MPLIEGSWVMISRKKYCNHCAETLTGSQQRAKENDSLKEDFFRYLLSLFPNLKDPPEHWYTQLELMLKKEWTVKNIRNTLVYCEQQGKEVTPENWGQLVYVYYNEAVAWVDKLRQLKERNDKVELKSNTVTVPFRSTTAYRDMPAYKMEDL